MATISCPLIAPITTGAMLPSISGRSYMITACIGATPFARQCRSSCICSGWTIM